MKQEILGSIIIRKEADQTVNNSDSLQPDNELKFAIGPDESYLVEYILLHNSNSTADLKLAVTAPEGAEVHTYISAYRANTTYGTVCRNGSGVASDIDGKDGVAMDKYTAIVINGENAGYVTLEWAQYQADESNTKVLANSVLKATRID